MSKQSPAQKIRAQLKFFIEHDSRLPKSEDVFVPARDLTIGFFVEGGVYVGGDRETFGLNLSSTDMLVLYLKKKDGEHIYRFPWARIVGFELIVDRGDDARTRKLFGVN